jgi:hypothetical protein
MRGACGRLDHLALGPDRFIRVDVEDPALERLLRLLPRDHHHQLLHRPRGEPLCARTARRVKRDGGDKRGRGWGTGRGRAAQGEWGREAAHGKAA